MEWQCKLKYCEEVDKDTLLYNSQKGDSAEKSTSAHQRIQAIIEAVNKENSVGPQKHHQRDNEPTVCIERSKKSHNILGWGWTKKIVGSSQITSW